MSGCCDHITGDLLHGYELGILSEEETKQFEMHLIECDECYREYQEFEMQSNLLTKDNTVRDVVVKYDRTTERSISKMTRLWHYLWPQTPLVFRPAFVYAIILAILVPVLWGPRATVDTETRQVNTITLSNGRDSGGAILRKSDSSLVVLGIVVEGVVAGRKCYWSITMENEEVPLESGVIDSLEITGDIASLNLSFHTSDKKPGNYWVTVIDSTAEPATVLFRSHFTVEP